MAKTIKVKKGNRIYISASKDGYNCTGLEKVVNGDEEISLSLSEKTNSFRFKVTNQSKSSGGKAWIVVQNDFYSSPEIITLGYCDLSNYSYIFEENYNYGLVPPYTMPIYHIGAYDVAVYSDIEMTTQIGMLYDFESNYIYVPENANTDGSTTVGEVTYNNTVVMPFELSGTRDYDFTLDYGDGTTETILGTDTRTSISHDYPTGSAQYTVTLTSESGKMPNFNSYNTIGDDNRVTDIIDPFLLMDTTSGKNTARGINDFPWGLWYKNPQINDLSYCVSGSYNIKHDLAKFSPLATTIDFMCSSTNLSYLSPDFLKNNSEITSASYAFYNASYLREIPDNFFANNKKCTNFSCCFTNCNQLKVTPNIFCNDTTESTTRFAGIPSAPDFSRCFERSYFSYSSYCKNGTAPQLWNYTYTDEEGTELTPISTDCFKGHTVDTLTNWLDIPESWGGPKEVTFKITPTPTDAIVKINGVEQSEITVKTGTYVSYEVSKEGYVTQSMDAYLIPSYISGTEHVKKITLKIYRSIPINDTVASMPARVWNIQNRFFCTYEGGSSADTYSEEGTMLYEYDSESDAFLPNNNMVFDGKYPYIGDVRYDSVNNKYVFACYGGWIVSTSDFITFEKHIADPTETCQYKSIECSNGVWIVCGDGSNGLRRSTDQGATWTTFTLPTTLSWYTSIRRFGSRIFLLGYKASSGSYKGSLYFSDNDGATWGTAWTSTPDITQNLVVSEEAIIASGYSKSKIMRSTDGVSWNTIENLPQPITESFYLGDGVFIGSGYLKKIFSTDHGATWQTSQANGSGVLPGTLYPGCLYNNKIYMGAYSDVCEIDKSVFLQPLTSE